MRITSAGLVGIGTSAPEEKLHVNGTVKSLGLLVKSVNDEGTLTLQNSTTGSGASNGFFLQAYLNDVYASNQENGKMFFRTNSTNRLTILADGKIGIGTSAPTVPLMVQSNETQPLLLKGANDKQMVVETTGGSTQITSYQLKNSAYSWQIENGRSANTFTIRSSGGGERMRIDSSGNLKFNSGYGSVATAYGCRAWVNFKGTGTVAIRESGNVSSITDLGTGFYQINFATAMTDVNYAVSGISRGYNDGASNPSNFTTTAIDRDTNSLSTGFVKICSGRTGSSGSTSSEFLDMETQTVAVFR
tara:strand:- start:524 stop:1432 length:909 start_codon:yes stop_codon:yes gene_type:complete